MPYWTDAPACFAMPSSWYAIPLRLMVGIGFMEHGYAKLARGPDDLRYPPCARNAVSDLAGMGDRRRRNCWWLSGFLGTYIPLVSLPMAVVLLVAIFTVHLPNGFSSIKLQSVNATGVISVSRIRNRSALSCRLASLIFGGSGLSVALNNLFSRRGDDRDTALKQDSRQSRWTALTGP